MGFDLAICDDKDDPEGALPIQFKFKKGKKLRELQEYIAAQEGCSADQLRLWVMVNRQNKTVRPDQPLLDLDRSRSAPHWTNSYANGFSCRGSGDEA
jgi:ubiquitin carboxyl-terminal hydrolase 7